VAILPFVRVNVVITVGSCSMGDDPLSRATVTLGAPTIGPILDGFALFQILRGNVKPFRVWLTILWSAVLAIFGVFCVFSRGGRLRKRNQVFDFSSDVIS
jgi:hypothetical protein